MLGGFLRVNQRAAKEWPAELGVCLWLPKYHCLTKSVNRATFKKCPRSEDIKCFWPWWCFLALPMNRLPITTGRDKERDLQQSPRRKAETVVWPIQKEKERKREDRLRLSSWCSQNKNLLLDQGENIRDKWTQASRICSLLSLNQQIAGRCRRLLGLLGS